MLFLVYQPGAVELEAAEDTDESEEVVLASETELFHRDRRNPGGRDFRLPFPLLIGGEIEAEWEEEKITGEPRTDHGALDSAEIFLEVEPWDWLVFESEVQWEKKADRITLEELSVELAPFPEDIPLKLEFGRKDPPFGEFESHFIQDNLPQIAGETVNDLALIVLELDPVELSAGWYGGHKFRVGDTDQWVADVRYEDEVIEAGIYWSSDIGVSEGLRGIRRDRILDLEEEAREAVDEEAEDGEGGDVETGEPGLRVPHEKVQGAGTFIVGKWEQFFFTTEVAGALENFRAGHLDDLKRKPVAWAVEGAMLVHPQFEIGLRLDGSDDLPEEPEWQAGISATWRPHPLLAFGVEALTGELEDGRDRDVLAARALIVF